MIYSSPTSVPQVNCEDNFRACGQPWTGRLFLPLSSLSLITDGIYFDSLFCDPKALKIYFQLSWVEEHRPLPLSDDC